MIYIIDLFELHVSNASPQVIGARFSEQFGGKLISLVIIFSSGIISFLIPFTARLGVIPMILTRALLGWVDKEIIWKSSSPMVVHHAVQSNLLTLVTLSTHSIAQSSVYPVYYCLVSKWFPENEHGKALAFLSNGAFVGTIIVSVLYFSLNSNFELVEDWINRL